MTYFLAYRRDTSVAVAAAGPKSNEAAGVPDRGTSRLSLTLRRFGWDNLHAPNAEKTGVVVTVEGEKGTRAVSMVEITSRSQAPRLMAPS